MKRKLLLIAIIFFHVQFLQAQKDSANKVDLSSIEDYDELFDELESFLDSLTKARSFTIVNLSVGNRVYNYKTASSSNLTTAKTLSLSPSVGYFSKSGLGINVAAAIIKESNRLNAYQSSATLSYDYLKNINFLTGLSFTRYFTRDSLNFYTSPLQNEVFAYFSYRRSWVKPSVSASYGWGSKTEVEERKDKIKSLLRGNGRGVSQVTTVESVRDFNINLALRHDFYWLDVFVSDDFVRFTPQLSVTGGTQNYGFNQNTSTNVNKKILNSLALYNAQNYSLEEKSNFQPLSLTAFLKSEFSKGKFFFQPQMMFDYYLPATSDRFSTTFILNSGIIF